MPYVPHGPKQTTPTYLVPLDGSHLAESVLPAVENACHPLPCPGDSPPCARSSRPNSSAQGTAFGQRRRGHELSR